MASRSVLYGVLALVLVGLFLVTQFRIQPDARAPGEVEDLLALATRDDLNVVFVLVDTLRADRLGVYGYERPTSPNLDHLARTGIRFARHYSQSSWTKTSMASLWTATYPHRNGILRFDHALPEAALLPAEALREEGFLTAGLWRNGWVAPTFGFDQGFDHYHRPTPSRKDAFQRQRRENPYARIDGSDIEVTDGAIEFFRINKRRRFFLYLHYMDAHQYMSDQESAIFGTTYSDLYDNSIHWTDRHLAALVAALEAEGLRDRTILVIVSDHGEAFGEHGKEGHAKDLHREVVETPWIISLPFSLEPGIVVDAISENVDVVPTLFDLLGLAPPEHADGRSRLPEILIAAGRPELRDREPAEGPLLAQLDHAWGKAEQPASPSIALTLADRRYMRSLTREEGGRARISATGETPAKLYRIDTDPLEQVNLLGGASAGGARPEGVETELAELAELEAMVAELLARPPPPWRDEVGRVELSEMQKGQLKAIGYAIE